MSAPQTLPNAQAVEGGLAVERFAALAADQRRKLRHIAKVAPMFSRQNAIKYLGIIADRETHIASSVELADIHASLALTRLGPNGLGPEIDGLARLYGAQ